MSRRSFYIFAHIDNLETLDDVIKDYDITGVILSKQLVERRITPNYGLVKSISEVYDRAIYVYIDDLNMHMDVLHADVSLFDSLNVDGYMIKLKKKELNKAYIVYLNNLFKDKKLIICLNGLKKKHVNLLKGFLLEENNIEAICLKESEHIKEILEELIDDNEFLKEIHLLLKKYDKKKMHKFTKFGVDEFHISANKI